MKLPRRRFLQLAAGRGPYPVRPAVAGSVGSVMAIGAFTMPSQAARTKSTLYVYPHLRYNPNMARRSMKVTTKKRGRGRPATGKDPLIAFRLAKDGIARVDRWAAANGYTRSEAIRVLIDQGIKE
jgi:hypothetical protein